jgi:hypothetical protein
MPGGGFSKGLQEIGLAGASALSPANAAGQHAFLASLQDGSSAAYRVDETGGISLILKSGMTTELGAINEVGAPFGGGIGINAKGQIVLPVQIDDGRVSVALLTPTTP